MELKSGKGKGEVGGEVRGPQLEETAGREGERKRTGGERKRGGKSCQHRKHKHSQNPPIISALCLDFELVTGGFIPSLLECNPCWLA